MTDANDADETICRYCLEGADAASGELISPCNCAGGQKWVHLSCLRRWQRGVLVSQPTHPDFYDDDLRHKVCNVCKSEYTCKPPTRLELMQSFTGGELAALVDEGCLIGTHAEFGDAMRRQLQLIPTHLRHKVVDSHWIDGVYLIVRVAAEKATGIQLQLDDEADLESFAASLDEQWCWRLGRRRCRLIFDGALAASREASAEDRRKAIRELRPPVCVRLQPVEDDCGEDGIVAVNLTQPFQLTGRRLARFERQSKDLSLALPVSHFRGGPCQEQLPQFAVLVRGPEDYKVFGRLASALQEAQTISQDAAARSDSPEPKRQRAECPSRLLVFWGTAGWSRCQLMGEIASGSWGLCKSFARDVASTGPDAVYASIYSRLVFAPKTEMSDQQDDDINAEELQRYRLIQLRRRLFREAAEAAVVSDENVLIPAAALEDLRETAELLGSRASSDEGSESSSDIPAESSDDDGDEDAEEESDAQPDVPAAESQAAT